MTFVARSLSPETPINIAQSLLTGGIGSQVTWDQVEAAFKSQGLQAARAKSQSLEELVGVQAIA